MTMKHYALIGEKLGHSLSVPIHEAIFHILGIDADYHLIEIPRDELTTTVPRLLQELDGFNVTIPYKKEVIPMLDNIDPFAADIGAVNTVLCTAPSRGFNTDAPGFTAMLQHYGIDPCGKPAYVLGGGGSSLTALSVLRKMGAKSIKVVSRTPQADNQISYDEFHRLFPSTGGVIINTTPVGMWPKVDDCPINPSILPYADGVADIIYNPPETVLTTAAKAAGIPACTGLYMLIDQAVKAEGIWQQMDMPDHLTDTLMKELKLL